MLPQPSPPDTTTDKYSAFYELDLNLRQISEILNDYYNLKSDEEGDYPEELQEFFRLWRMSDGEFQERYKNKPGQNVLGFRREIELKISELKAIGVDVSSYEEGGAVYSRIVAVESSKTKLEFLRKENLRLKKMMDAAATLDAMAKQLEMAGIEGAEKYRPGSVFFRKMIQDPPVDVSMDPDMKTRDAFYNDPNIAMFMREAMSLVNLLLRLRKKGTEANIGMVNTYMAMFPTPDEDEYVCLAGVRDAQMDVYMDALVKKLPWRDRVVVGCHRSFVAEYRDKTICFIDELFARHAFSALEHFFGIESKEKDTLKAMSQIPAEMACNMIANYHGKMMEMVRHKVDVDRVEAYKFVKKTLISDPLTVGEIARTIAYFRKEGVIISEDMVVRLKGDLTADLESEVKINDVTYFSLDRPAPAIEEIFPYINIEESVTLPRPQSLFDASVGDYKPKFGEAGRRVAALVLSDNELDQEAGLQSLALIGLESQAGHSPAQFLNFIHQIGLTQGYPPNVAIDMGIQVIATLAGKDNDRARDIFTTYQKLIDSHAAYVSALRTGLRRSLEEALAVNPAQVRLDQTVPDIANCLRILNGNKKLLEALVNNPNAIRIFVNIFNKGQDIPPEEALLFGRNLLYLAVRFKRRDIINYVIKGFNADRSNTIDENGQTMLKNGLLYSELSGGVEVSGLEYLIQYYPEMLSKVQDVVALLRTPLSEDGQTIIHRLARRGDAASILKSIESLSQKPKEVLLLLTRRVGVLRKTPIHFALENALRNPSQSGVVVSLMNRITKIISKKDIRLDEGEENPMGFWEEEENPLVTAVMAGRVRIVEVMASGLVTCRLNHVILAVLYRDGDHLKNPEILRALMQKLSLEERCDLLMHYAKSGNLTALKVLIDLKTMITIFTTDTRESLLHIAVKRGDFAMMDCLLDAEKKMLYSQRGVIAMSSLRDKNDDSPIMVAAKRERFDIVEHLVTKGVSFTEAEQRFVFEEAFCKLQKYKKDLSKYDRTSEIFRTIQYEQMQLKDSLKRLIVNTKGIKSLVDIEKRGNPPAIKAICWGRGDLAKLMIELGIDDIGSKGVRGTILHYAAQKYNLDMIDYLTASLEDGGQGMSPEILNSAGLVPMVEYENGSSEALSAVMSRRMIERVGREVASIDLSKPPMPTIAEDLRGKPADSSVPVVSTVAAATTQARREVAVGAARRPVGSGNSRSTPTLSRVSGTSNAGGSGFLERIRHEARSQVAAGSGASSIPSASTSRRAAAVRVGGGFRHK